MSKYFKNIDKQTWIKAFGENIKPDIFVQNMIRYIEVNIKETESIYENQKAMESGIFIKKMLQNMVENDKKSKKNNFRSRGKVEYLYNDDIERETLADVEPITEKGLEEIIKREA